MPGFRGMNAPAPSKELSQAGFTDANVMGSFDFLHRAGGYCVNANCEQLRDVGYGHVYVYGLPTHPQGS